MATEVIKIVDPDNGSGTDYTSLAAAVAGEASIRADLVARNEQLTFECRCTGGTADGGATLTGFTTDATHFIKIWTHPTSGYRHAGKIVTGNKYLNSVANSVCLTISCGYVYIDGLQIIKTSGSGTGQHGIAVTSCEYARISNVVVKMSHANSWAERAFNLVINTKAVDLFNCVAYNGSTLANSYNCGILVSGVGVVCRAYNCTVFDWNSGFAKMDYGALHCYNCIAANSTYSNGDFVAVATRSYCASDDTGGTNSVRWLNGATDWANVFADYANGDFSLNNYTGTGAVIGAGTDNPGSGLYSDDILGNARTSPWDIGAFEYVSGAPSGITGTLAATLADATLVATGALAITGSLASTLADSTLAATGSLAVAGAAAATLADATLAATGKLLITGATAATLADATLAATGALAIKGALASTLADATLVATGASTIEGAGSLAVTLADATLAATGTLTGEVPITGTLAVTLASATLAASGSLLIVGRLAVTLADAYLGAPPSEGGIGSYFQRLWLWFCRRSK